MIAVGRDKIDYIKAIVRLYEFCSSKKFHLLKQEFINDDIGKLAIEINNDIKNDKGVNIFEAKDDQDLMEYEKVLNNYNLNFTRKNFEYIKIGDDLVLLNNSTNFSTEKLKNVNIIISPNVKEYATKLMTIPTTISYARSADYINIIKDENEKHTNYFLTSKIKYKNQERLVFMHLAHGSEKILRVIDGNKHTVLDDKNFAIILIMVFKPIIFEKYLNNPTIFFLKILELYGIDIKIENYNQRFYYEFLTTNIDLNDEPAFFKELKTGKKYKNIFYYYSLKGTSLAFRYKFIYGIDMDKYFSDIAKGSI